MLTPITRKPGRPPGAKNKNKALKKLTKVEKVPKPSKIKIDSMQVIIDYIWEHCQGVERTYMNNQISRKGWTKEYYIASTFKGMFGIIDPNLNLEKYKK